MFSLLQHVSLMTLLSANDTVLFNMFIPVSEQKQMQDR